MHIKLYFEISNFSFCESTKNLTKQALEQSPVETNEQLSTCFLFFFQVLPDVPPAMADAVNRGGEILANLTAGTPWETVARDVGNTLGVDSKILRAENSKDIDLLVDVITSWMTSNTGPKLLRP